MKKNAAFTLIEVLITISIIGILVTLSTFAFGQARQSARDAQRKSDLSQIKSALEFYRSDAFIYPASLGSSITYGTPPNQNVYMADVPEDPTTSQDYCYTRLTNYTYILCAALEGGGSDTCTCSCGGATCNYKVVNP